MGGDRFNSYINFFTVVDISKEELNFIIRKNKNILEKETTKFTALLRKIIENEEFIWNIINNFTILVKKINFM